jgi:hypothetical protein
MRGWGDERERQVNAQVKAEKTGIAEMRRS